jgi:DEP domain-containing protein 5
VPPVDGTASSSLAKASISRPRAAPEVNQPYYVSLGDHVHKLFYDASGNNVQVKRYIRKIKYPTDAFTYRCAIWPNHLNRYQDRTIEFTYPPLVNYNWNYLDHLISGYQEQLTENLRFWRARFVLVPLEQLPTSFSNANEVLDEEEERLAGFKKFIDLFEKARVNRCVSGTKPSRIEITYTTSSLASHFGAMQKENIEGAGASSTSANEKLTVDMLNSTPGLVMQQMQSPNGVGIRDRVWHFRRYEQAFVGEECIDWLLARFGDIESREAGVEFGNMLLKQGYIEHVYSKHQFLDGFYFYKMSKKSKGLLASEVVEKTVASTKFNNQVTKQILLDMDPNKKSSRKEIAVLHYDTTHNPNSCYHFQIHWLVCTARLIEDQLNIWTRMGEKYGLKIVEAPVDQVGVTSGEPFQSIIPISFAIPPPRHTFTDQPQFFQVELCKKFNFVLDVERDCGMDLDYSYTRKPWVYTQYIHRSGVAFMQIQSDDSFVFVNNRLHLASQNLRNLGTDPDHLRTEIAAFCADQVALTEFWDVHQKRLDILMQSAI